MHVYVSLAPIPDRRVIYPRGFLLCCVRSVGFMVVCSFWCCTIDLIYLFWLWLGIIWCSGHMLVETVALAVFSGCYGSEFWLVYDYNRELVNRKQCHKDKIESLISMVKNHNSYNTDKTIKQVATAKIVGLSCSLRPVHI